MYIINSSIIYPAKKETHHLDIRNHFLIEWTQKYVNFIQATLIIRKSI